MCGCNIPLKHLPSPMNKPHTKILAFLLPHCLYRPYLSLAGRVLTDNKPKFNFYML